MKPENITKIFESIHPELQKMEDTNTEHILLNPMAPNDARLKQDDQLQINHLKGEQGKPEINPNIVKDGNISSEDELKKAEKSEEEILPKVKLSLNDLLWSTRGKEWGFRILYTPCSYDLKWQIVYDKIFAGNETIPKYWHGTLDTTNYGYGKLSYIACQIYDKVVSLLNFM